MNANTDTMDSLHNTRHTLAHLLASAVLEHYPHALPATGPATDTGFFYDFDFSAGEKPTEKDLQKIEQTMRAHLKQWHAVVGEEVSEKTAREAFAKNPYKLELIDEIVARKEVITFHTSQSETGEALFTDLCEGGHEASPREHINSGSFCLDRLAGAYWRGNEERAMLTRIYGLAFATPEELTAYNTQREEAKKYDHRILGKQLDLFTFSELVGAGLPLWTPKGTILRNTLDDFVWELRNKHGYSRVTIPHITKKDLYEKSGHWEKFAEELFIIRTREDKLYAVKPMNCPHHTQIFARKPHSYREMPQRYAETTMVYRDEQSGELGGLTRVLSITQDDSHVFCRTSQVKEEFYKIWDIIDTLYTYFGFSLRTRLSFHDPEHIEKYLGTAEVWHAAEQSLRELAQERNADYFEAAGEAAMYGPKLDFMAKDSLGREHQVATIQLDMNLPERFDLTCINEQGEKERVVMIHAAIMGSIERFVAVLLEHLRGELPCRISPEQVRIIPVAAAHHAYATLLHDQLRTSDVRSSIDTREEPLGKRIRAAREDHAYYTLVIGDKEVSSGTLTLEHGEEKEVVEQDALVTHLAQK
jgi:threonyl-tRNA synthetase